MLNEASSKKIKCKWMIKYLYSCLVCLYSNGHEKNCQDGIESTFVFDSRLALWLSIDRNHRFFDLLKLFFWLFDETAMFTVRVFDISVRIVVDREPYFLRHHPCFDSVNHKKTYGNAEPKSGIKNIGAFQRDLIFVEKFSNHLAVISTENYILLNTNY